MNDHRRQQIREGVHWHRVGRQSKWHAAFLHRDGAFWLAVTDDRHVGAWLASEFPGLAANAQPAPELCCKACLTAVRRASE